jgi:hypothetical protein
MHSNPYLFSSLKLHGAPLCSFSEGRKGLKLAITDAHGLVSVRFDPTYHRVYGALSEANIRTVRDGNFATGANKAVMGEYTTPTCRLSDEDFMDLVEEKVDREAETLVDLEQADYE